jgi:hypothetical protein
MLLWFNVCRQVVLKSGRGNPESCLAKISPAGDTDNSGADYDRRVRVAEYGCSSSDK